MSVTVIGDISRSPDEIYGGRVLSCERPSVLEIADDDDMEEGWDFWSAPEVPEEQVLIALMCPANDCSLYIGWAVGLTVHIEWNIVSIGMCCAYSVLSAHVSTGQFFE